MKYWVIAAVCSPWLRCAPDLRAASRAPSGAGPSPTARRTQAASSGSRRARNTTSRFVFPRLGQDRVVTRAAPEGVTKALDLRSPVPAFRYALAQGWTVGGVELCSVPWGRISASTHGHKPIYGGQIQPLSLQWDWGQLCSPGWRWLRVSASVKVSKTVPRGVSLALRASVVTAKGGLHQTFPLWLFGKAMGRNGEKKKKKTFCWPSALGWAQERCRHAGRDRSGFRAAWHEWFFIINETVDFTW